MFDDNHDGVIDSKDPVWPRLRLWIDANHNGISEPNELFALEQLDICSINLAYKLDKKKDQWGNSFTYHGTTGRCKRGAFDRTIYDVNFVLANPGNGKCSAEGGQN